jgi:hypothetical protein
MSLILLHVFLSIVRCHATHSASPVSPTQSSTISTILKPPSKPQATCKLQHTIPLPPSYKRPSVSRSPTDHLFYQSTRSPNPQAAPIHSPSLPAPFPIAFHNVLYRSILLHPLHAPQCALLDLQRPRARPPTAQVRHAQLPPSVSGVLQGEIHARRWRSRRPSKC